MQEGLPSVALKPTPVVNLERENTKLRLSSRATFLPSHCFRLFSDTEDGFFWVLPKHHPRYFDSVSPWDESETLSYRRRKFPPLYHSARRPMHLIIDTVVGSNSAAPLRSWTRVSHPALDGCFPLRWCSSRVCLCLVSTAWTSSTQTRTRPVGALTPSSTCSSAAPGGCSSTWAETHHLKPHTLQLAPLVLLLE